MLKRVAIFEGVIVVGGEDAFFDQVREQLKQVRKQLEPIWRRFPNVLDVRVRRTREADRGAIKTEAHEPTLKVLKPSSDRFFQVITECLSVPATAQD